MLFDVGTPEPSTPKELVGEVDVPSGRLVLIDFGTLNLWSGEDEPILKAGDAPDNVVKIANSKLWRARVDAAYGRAAHRRRRRTRLGTEVHAGSIRR